MFKWVILTSVIIAGSILTYLYYDVKALESNPDALPMVQVDDTVRMLHSYENGVHRYVGSIKLPHSCHSVAATITKDQKLVDMFELRITTRDLEMETPFCSRLTSRFQFSVDEEGPEVVSLKVKVNGKPSVFKIVETTTATTDLSNQKSY